MEPSTVPQHVRETYPHAQVFPVGPPPGIADEDCGTIEALHRHASGGAFDGAPEFRVYWKPDAVDLEVLNNGGVVEVVYLAPQLVPHYVTAHTAE